MAGRFGTVLTAMATPFTAQGELDVDGVRTLAEHLLAHGTDALVVAGTTGESPTLSFEEKRLLWATSVDVAHAQGKQVVCGTGTYATAESIELTKLAAETGADGVLVVTPYYNKPPQRCLVDHFTAVAGATSLPVVLYNIPGRTGTRIDHQTLLTLSSVGNIVGVKDSTGDMDGVSHLLAEAPAGFDVYSGDDWATFPMMSLGAAGVVSVATHVAGDRIAEMAALLDKGELDAARRIHLSLLDVFDALFSTASPIPLKAALEMLGLPAGPLRAPLSSATPDERAVVETALRNAGLL